MRVLSLFSGIGGMDLGLERAGMTVVGQCEIDPFCRAVLAKHWPGVPRFEDARTLTAEQVHERCGIIDIIAAGVPCQPSAAGGQRRGANDDRWMWPHFARLVRGCRPCRFLAENPTGFLTLPDSVGAIRDLEGAGYSTRTYLLSAADMGSPHGRDRHWIVGHAHSVRQPRPLHSRKLRAPGREVPGDSTVGPVPVTWPPRPGVVGEIPIAADGLPRGLAGRYRQCCLTAIGNAAMPVIVEAIGRAIMSEVRP